MQIYFTVNVGRKFRDSSWCTLNRRCLLNTVGGLTDTGSTVAWLDSLTSYLPLINQPVDMDCREES